MNTHKLLTKCKKILKSKYNCTFSKPCPTKREILSQMLSVVLTDDEFKIFNEDTLLITFYAYETGKVERITGKTKNGKLVHTQRAIHISEKRSGSLSLISEGSSVIPKRIKKERYINCSPLEEDIPF